MEFYTFNFKRKYNDMDIVYCGRSDKADIIYLISKEIVPTTT